MCIFFVSALFFILSSLCWLITSGTKRKRLKLEEEGGCSPDCPSTSSSMYSSDSMTSAGHLGVMPTDVVDAAEAPHTYTHYIYNPYLCVQFT